MPKQPLPQAIKPPRNIKRPSSKLPNLPATSLLPKLSSTKKCYSQIALKIAQALPPGIVLESLELDAKTFGTPLTVQALCKSYDDALRLKSSFEQSDAFENVNIASVSQSTGEDAGAYSFSITMNVTIRPEVIRQ